MEGERGREQVVTPVCWEFAPFIFACSATSFRGLGTVVTLQAVTCSYLFTRFQAEDSGLKGEFLARFLPLQSWSTFHSGCGCSKTSTRYRDRFWRDLINVLQFILFIY